MHNELSPLDELFRNANQEQEKIPVEANWEKMRKMLIAKGVIKRYYFFKLLFLTSSVLLFLTTLIYILFYTNIHEISQQNYVQKKIQTENHISKYKNIKNKNDIITPEQTQEILQNNKTADTNKKAFNNNYYKVQIGAFKRKNNTDIFPLIKGVVSEEKDGYCKYYAGVYTNKFEALKKLKEMKDIGFYDAFIPKDISPVRNINTSYNPETTSFENTTEQEQPVQVQQQHVVPNEQKKPDEEKPTVSEEQKKPSIVDTEIKDTAETKITLNTQNNQKDIVEKPVIPSPFSIGIYSSYDINHFRVSSQNAYGTYLLDNNSNLLNGLNNTTFTICLQGSYRFNNIFSTEIGIAFAQKKKLELSNLQYSDEESYSFSYSGKYIEAPLRLRYYVKHFNSVSFFVSPGIVFNSNYPAKDKGYFILKHPLDSAYYEHVTLQSKSIGISWQLGIGMEYMLRKKLRFFVASYYNYGMSAVVKHPTYRNTPVKHFNNTVNIGFGCYYDF